MVILVFWYRLAQWQQLLIRVMEKPLDDVLWVNTHTHIYTHSFPAYNLSSSYSRYKLLPIQILSMSVQTEHSVQPWRTENRCLDTGRNTNTRVYTEGANCGSADQYAWTLYYSLRPRGMKGGGEAEGRVKRNWGRAAGEHGNRTLNPVAFNIVRMDRCGPV